MRVALTVTEERASVPVPVSVDILPANLEAEIMKAKQGRMALERLFSELLVPGVDYDRVPGTDKPTLLKPGAEILCQPFHLAPGKPDILAREENFETGVFSYLVGVPIIHRDTGALVAYGIGAANSKEPKYRYRKERSGTEVLKVENPDPAGEQNTLVKMAAKRAFIDGVLKATGASRMFTQDAEDMLNLPPEKASTKQLDYIRTLVPKGSTEEQISEKVQEILGLDEPVALGDLTRDQASQVIEALKQSGKTKAGQTPKPPASAPKPAPKPKASSHGNDQGGINWTPFWKTVNDLGIDRDTVHAEASAAFGCEVKSLKDVIKTQQELDDFLEYLKSLKESP